ncbi:Nn.00g052380.m01.CDS01 [Neocucurbitaria sp. VM-36]
MATADGTPGANPTALTLEEQKARRVISPDRPQNDLFFRKYPSAAHRGFSVAALPRYIYVNCKNGSFIVQQICHEVDRCQPRLSMCREAPFKPIDLKIREQYIGVSFDLSELISRARSFQTPEDWPPVCACRSPIKSPSSRIAEIHIAMVCIRIGIIKLAYDKEVNERYSSRATAIAGQTRHDACRPFHSNSGHRNSKN